MYKFVDTTERQEEQILPSEALNLYSCQYPVLLPALVFEPAVLQLFLRV